MATSLYPLYVALAAATVASPGPGVVMTLTNAVRYGFFGALAGILGIAAGAVMVAGLSATGVGLVLATSAMAFTVLKLMGAAYLVYMGIKLWNSRTSLTDDPGAAKPETTGTRGFTSALSLQLTNPKPIVFFVSVFPQFIDASHSYEQQFSLLVATYACLILVIHSAYAVCVHRARGWLASPTGGRLVNRAGGAAFVGFGILLATSKR